MKLDSKEPYFMVKGFQPVKSAFLASPFARYVNLGKVLMLFVSQFPHLKIIIIVLGIRGYCKV